MAAAFAPGLAAARASRHAARSLHELGPIRAAVVRAEADLNLVSGALDEVSGFENGRRSTIGFLAALSDALPPTAQLVAVRLDSAGGNLVVISPRAGDALSRVERLGDVEAPEIVGPVTREYVGQQEKERVTIRFRWRRAARGGKR